MIFDFKEVECIFLVLKILNRSKSKYSTMFKQTKVSHTTLQKVLKELVEKKFIVKYNRGHKDVDYEITSKGERFLENLLQLQEILK